LYIQKRCDPAVPPAPWVERCARAIPAAQRGGEGGVARRSVQRGADAAGINEALAASGNVADGAAENGAAVDRTGRA